MQHWSHTLTIASPRFRQRWRAFITVNMASKIAHNYLPEELTVENTNRTKQHTMISNRTLLTTKKEKKDRKTYLRICVRDIPNLGRPLLTKNIGRRLNHISHGLRHTKLTKKQNTNISDTNPIHRLRHTIMTKVMSLVVRTTVPRPIYYHSIQVRWDLHTSARGESRQ